MANIIKKPKALLDIKSIWHYTFSNFGEKQANLYIDTLSAKLNLLRTSPLLGVDCSYIKPGYRKLLVNQHVVFYFYNGTSVTIVRILHKRMESSKLLE